MASTSNSQTATSSLSSLRKCEVFINFRGADTRNNFTDHLYQALVDKGITTFRDDEELEPGKPISPELLNAIETSRVAVVVLSKTYASSTWCLEELAKIVERMSAGRMRVFPIFYHVDPSDVRHQKGTFGDAFIKHEKHPEEVVQRWRVALKDVANLAGHHLKDGPESKFIRNLVGDIFQHLNDTKYGVGSAYEAYLVGIDFRFRELELCMDLASDDALFVGITGMRGIGKTTLAQVAFERIRCQFEETSFLKDDKRSPESQLREQLLQDLKLATPLRTPKWTEAQGINVMSDRLHHKKVLIVLDDVKKEKFDKLALKLKWFGPGSRIMLTSTDEGFLLSKCRKENIYKIKKLNTEDALLLLSWKVFDKIHRQQDLVDICSDLVSYAGGNPLALQVLGSYLRTKESHLWKAMLKELRTNPKNSLKRTLETSIDGLNSPQKELFLDIACFFNGVVKDFVSNILEGSHGIRADHIDDLVNKSLITIFEGKLWVHSLLQDIGQQIVKERGVTRSRIWDWEGVFEVLKDKREMDLVEGIM